MSKHLYRFGENTVLLDLDAGVKRLDSVTGEHRDRRLEQDWPGVDHLGDEVDGASGDLDALCQCLLDRVIPPAKDGSSDGWMLMIRPVKDLKKAVLRIRS